MTLRYKYTLSLKYWNSLVGVLLLCVSLVGCNGSKEEKSLDVAESARTVETLENGEVKYHTSNDLFCYIEVDSVSDIEQGLDIMFRDGVYYTEDECQYYEENGDCVVGFAPLNQVYEITLNTDKFAFMGIKVGDTITETKEILKLGKAVQLQYKKDNEIFAAFQLKDSNNLLLLNIEGGVVQNITYFRDKADYYKQYKDIDDNYVLHHDESIGYYFDGSGYFVEYFSTSLAGFYKQYKELTTYNQKELLRRLDGQYMILGGVVTGVGGDGTITIHDVNEDIGAQGMADVQLNESYNSILSSINEGDELQVIAKIHEDSFSEFFFVPVFSLTDGFFVKDAFEYSSVYPISDIDKATIESENLFDGFFSGNHEYGKSEINSMKSSDEVLDRYDFIISDSNSRYYSENELVTMSKKKLRLARNEIYARHGRQFKSEDLNEYFNAQPWYNGYIAADDFDDSVLNEYEKANLILIKSVEDRASEYQLPDYITGSSAQLGKTDVINCLYTANNGTTMEIGEYSGTGETYVNFSQNGDTVWSGVVTRYQTLSDGGLAFMIEGDNYLTGEKDYIEIEWSTKQMKNSPVVVYESDTISISGTYSFSYPLFGN